MAGTHHDRLLIEAGQRDPAEQQVLLLDPATGELAPLADGPGVHSVQACAGTLLLTTADADGIRRTVRTADGRTCAPADLSAPLPYRAAPLLERVTEHGVPTALVLPAAMSPAGGYPSSWTATAAPASRTCPPSRAAGSTASGGPTGASPW